MERWVIWLFHLLFVVELKLFFCLFLLRGIKQRASCFSLFSSDPFPSFPFLSFRLSFHLSFPFLSKTKWTESQQTMKQKHKWKTKNQNNGNGTLFFFFFKNKLKNINSFELLFLSLCFALAFPPSLPHTLQAFSPLTFDGDRQMAQTIRPCIQILQLMSHENILFIPFHILLRSSS